MDDVRIFAVTGRLGAREVPPANAVLMFRTLSEARSAARGGAEESDAVRVVWEMRPVVRYDAPEPPETWLAVPDGAKPA